MNFLAHIYLSAEDPELKIGNFIADSVKGRKYEQFPPRISQGIQLHRKIDHFTDTHTIVQQSILRIKPKYKRYSAVIVDLYYDHFLAANWTQYSETSLKTYAAQFYDLLQSYYNILPDRIQNFMPYMIRHNWLLQYATLPGIATILHQMNQRTKNRSKMNFAVVELEQYYIEFQKEFESFFEELRDFSAKEIQEILNTSDL